MAKSKLMYWKVHTPNLLAEISNCNDLGPAMRVPLNMLRMGILAIAERAAQINDHELNRLMLQMALYEAGDPTSPKYDKKVMRSYGL